MKRDDVEVNPRIEVVRDEGSWKSVVRIFKNKNVIAIFYARVAFSLSVGVFSTLFAIYAEKDVGLTPSLIALLFSFRGITNLITRMPSGRLSDRVGRRKPFLFAYGMIVGVFTILPYTQNFIALAIVMFIYGAGWGMRIAPSTALLTESVRVDDRPLALSIFITMFDVGSTIGALLAGVAVTLLSTPTLLHLCVPITLSGWVIFLITTETVPQSREPIRSTHP